MDLASLDSWGSPHINNVLSALENGQLGYLNGDAPRTEVWQTLRSINALALHPSLTVLLDFH